MQFHTWKDALTIIAVLPFAEVGGAVSLLVTHTSFSISAAVGFTSLTVWRRWRRWCSCPGCVGRSGRTAHGRGWRRLRGRDAAGGDGVHGGGAGAAAGGAVAGHWCAGAATAGSGRRGRDVTTILAVLFVLPMLLRSGPSVGRRTRSRTDRAFCRFGVTKRNPSPLVKLFRSTMVGGELSAGPDC